MPSKTPKAAEAVPVEQSPPPDVLDAADAPAAADPPAAEQADPAPGLWEYTGPPGRIYANVPVTVDPGDVIAWAGVPADDGAWRPAADGATPKRPDSHRPDPGVPVLTGDGVCGLYADGGVTGG